ncbi:MAG TPA: DUF1003 domain-containing protein [Candidatus Limnocylindria bacterium]
MSHLRFHSQHAHLSAPFGQTTFGQLAESFARFFGTPQFLIGQTVVVAAWIVTNAIGVASFDPMPFILLNLGFSLQAAYAAPLILLAQTRQAERDKALSDADAMHREELAKTNLELLKLNTDVTKRIAELTERIEQLTEEIHASVARASG